MNVLFYDVVAKLPLGNAQQVGNLHDLLGQCDIVSLHMPDLPSTHWMIGAKEIAALKPGAIFINASRGTVVEIEPLAQAIKSGQLLNAAVDVFPSEPKSNKDEFRSGSAGLIVAAVICMDWDTAAFSQEVGREAHRSGPAPDGGGRVGPTGCGDVVVRGG